ncbi:DUF5710 domain-containing protein [Pseudomonas nunensis]|uniref:DUF5710 domain-containing protein n=1 Tax=Pseudomonas nunensis TaxID=2961896 RepID=UPI0025AF4BFD|nr:DUF5710 domain-containing protein [Pseudomonas nunensis]MDN3224173.1 DUF5710 domain-containing protein [Pseudomonas nunensis]
MARIDLEVPFAEKDEAKALGARWDPKAKIWYAPDGVPGELFARWMLFGHRSDLEHEPEFCLRSPYYFIVESASDCWRCSRITDVYSFMLPELHKQFEYAQDEEEEFALDNHMGYWVCHGYRGTVASVNGLSLSVIKQLRLHTENYKPAYSKAARNTYYMNHCEHCGAKLGDFYMHSEPGGAFFPTSPEQAEAMILHQVNEQFDANGGVGCATDDFMDCMQRGRT